MTSQDAKQGATQDTIYALSSPPGRGGVAVVRVSGPQALDSYHALTRKGRAAASPREKEKPDAQAAVPPQEKRKLDAQAAASPREKEKPDAQAAASPREKEKPDAQAAISRKGKGYTPSSHRAALCKIYRPAPSSGQPGDKSELRKYVSRETLDHALVIYFENPRSFTGEDVVEYHLHGGPAVVNSVLEVLGVQDNHRMAEPGEFTRRAFENGRVDLTGAEAIADLIHAETQMQAAQALSQLEGGLSEIYEGWSETLKKTLAHLEADIEFPDEDLPLHESGEISPGIFETIKKLHAEITEHLSDNRRGERLRDGLKLAILGAPNAGKSTLINALTRRDIAIVSDTAGTTRDVIEAHLNLGGYPVIIADTAGLRLDESDGIESEGIKRAKARAAEADLKILLFDGTKNKADENILALQDDNAITVINKSDEAQNLDLPGALKISAKTGGGVKDLEAALIKKIEDIIGNVSRETSSLTRARHREALEEALSSLTRAQDAALPELMAEDLRLGVRSLGRITGRVDVEDLLDVIFKDFCIGK